MEGLPAFRETKFGTEAEAEKGKLPSMQALQAHLNVEYEN